MSTHLIFYSGLDSRYNRSRRGTHTSLSPVSEPHSWGHQGFPRQNWHVKWECATWVDLNVFEATSKLLGLAFPINLSSSHLTPPSVFSLIWALFPGGYDMQTSKMRCPERYFNKNQRTASTDIYSREWATSLSQVLTGWESSFQPTASDIMSFGHFLLETVNLRSLLHTKTNRNLLSMIRRDVTFRVPKTW